MARHGPGRVRIDDHPVEVEESPAAAFLMAPPFPVGSRRSPQPGQAPSGPSSRSVGTPSRRPVPRNASRTTCRRRSAHRRSPRWRQGGQQEIKGVLNTAGRTEVSARRFRSPASARPEAPHFYPPAPSDERHEGGERADGAWRTSCPGPDLAGQDPMVCALLSAASQPARVIEKVAVRGPFGPRCRSTRTAGTSNPPGPDTRPAVVPDDPGRFTCCSAGRVGEGDVNVFRRPRL